MKRALICANPSCGYVMCRTSSTREQDWHCQKCGCVTHFTFAGGKMTAELEPDVLRPKRDDELDFDDFDQLMRSSRYVDFRKC